MRFTTTPIDGVAILDLEERGLRYDDPALGLTWPLPVAAISEKDAAWPLLESVGALS
jgi:dTDP-4-dehydrorhamnose 3,5-epimerase-like enzyme